MRRLRLVAGLVLVLVGCGSSGDGKKDAARGTPDAGATSDGPVVRDLGTADCGVDCFPQDLAGIDVPSPLLDAAQDVVTDSSGSVADGPPEDVPPDVAADVAADLKPDTAPDVVAMCGRINCDCTFNGKKLYGRYKVVDVFPDFKVRVTNVFEDLDVEKVTVFPDSCGNWQEDDTFPDFTVQFVDVFEDFSIKYVNVFPGIP
jgi:hypothetical protein